MSVFFNDICARDRCTLPAKSLEPRQSVSKKPEGPWQKTVAVAKKILLGAVVFVGTVLGNIVTFGIPTILSRVSNYKRNGIKKAVEKCQIEHVGTALFCGLKGKEKWQKQSDQVSMDRSSLFKETNKNGRITENEEYFIQEVVGLRDQICDLYKQQKNSEVSVGSLEKVYLQFQKLVQNPNFMDVYHSLEPKDHSGVNFLKLLAAKFRSANVSDLLIQHAKSELGFVSQDADGGYTIGKTGEILAKYRDQPSFKQNFLWAISHPFAWYHALNSRFLHNKYDSHEANPTYSVHEIEYPRNDGKASIKARFIAGPTPFNDPVYEQIFSKNGHELRFNIMDMSKERNEAPWIKKMDRIAHESNGHTQQVVWGFSTKKKKGFLKPTDLDPLINGYKNALLKENACRSLNSSIGVKIPEALLSDQEIENACQHAKALIQELKPDLTQKAARHAALVIVDTMMATGMIIRYLDGLKDLVDDPNIDEDMRAVHIAIACKQCFDRGPVYFAALMLFIRSLSNSKPLNEDEFYKITGLPVFRAPLNEGREQIKEKFSVYEKLAQTLGANMDKLSMHTQTFRDSFLSR
jgi:hypothetical protein